MYALLGLSLLFVAIGFILTKNNAKYLLSGYNTMSEKEREKVDIEGYVPYFRKFHIFLGISLFVVGALLMKFVSVNVGGIFLAVYPILAYIYFAISGRKFSKEKNRKKELLTIFILGGVLVFIVALLAYGFKENELIIENGQIEIAGEYGEIIPENDIRKVELVNELPEISIRTNGFSLGTIKKGFYKTKEGEKIKLILNGYNKPYLLIVKENGQKIYYSAKEKPNEDILDEMKKVKFKIGQ